MTIALRDYQVRAREDLRAAYGRARAVLLVMPTGAGKTVLFVDLAARAAGKGKRVLILVHRKTLLDQASRTLERWGVEHGRIAPGASLRLDAGVQVASVQTLVRRLGRLRGWAPDLIVVDEAHHATPDSGWGRVLAHWPGAKILGVTATPERLDGQGLGTMAGGFFEDLVSGPSVADLVRAGYLARPVVFAARELPDYTGVGMRGGDYVRGAAAARADVPRVTGDVVEHYQRLLQGAPALAFCESVAHAEHVAEAFRSAGLRAASIDGGLDDREQRARIRDLGAGALQVVTSCEIVSEGTDVPIVAGALLIRRTASLGLYLQQVGRALRPYPGKERAVVLDHVGNCHTHGLPDEDREWSLAATKRAAREVAPEPRPERGAADACCPACGARFRPAPRCPACGAALAVQDGWDFVDGELVPMDPTLLRRRHRQEERTARTLADFEAIAARRGYKPGWARHRWEARERADARRADELARRYPEVAGWR